MSILGKISDFVSGGLFKEVKEAVIAYLPPDLSPTQKADIELKVQALLHKKELEINRVIEDSAKQLDKRISEQEGTASDLKQMPYFGAVIIFFRGMQRPLWGYATMVMDYKWFFESGEYTEQQQTAMIIVNVLVLGFLFGERTIKNLEPLITRVFAK